MYLIPKNIKIKKEIFKGFGIIELLVMGISFGLGYLLSIIANGYKLKVFLFSILPLTTFLLLLPLPNGNTAFKILLKLSSILIKLLFNCLNNFSFS